MRTTVDFPDPVYRELKVRAASEGTTIREMILEGVALRLRSSSAVPSQENRPRFPTVASRKPGSLRLGEEGVYEFIPFP
jgi:hypothetical protein